MEGRKIKFISAILIFIFMFNYFVMLSPVLAISSTAEKNQEYLNNMIDLIPDEISLDLSELEYKQADEEISNKVKDILINKGSDIEDVEIIVNDIYIYLGVEEFHRAYLYLKYNNIVSNRKQIALKYNNSNNWNNADKEYVKNLNIVNGCRYFVMDAKKLSNNKKTVDDKVEYIENKLSTYFTNLIDDDYIEIIVNSGQRWWRTCHIWIIWMLGSF